MVEDHTGKGALYGKNKESHRTGTVGDKSPCKLVYFIIKLFYGSFDLNPVLRKDIAPVKVF